MSGHWVPSGGDAPGPRRVGDSLGRVTKGLGMAAPDALRGVFGRWADVVGDQVAAHAQPHSLKDGTLVVTVDQPGWATQLRYLEADLLRRLAEVAGEGAVKRIEVRVKRA